MKTMKKTHENERKFRNKQDGNVEHEEDETDKRRFYSCVACFCQVFFFEKNMVYDLMLVIIIATSYSVLWLS